MDILPTDIKSGHLSWKGHSAQRESEGQGARGSIVLTGLNTRVTERQSDLGFSATHCALVRTWAWENKCMIAAAPLLILSDMVQVRPNKHR